MEQIFPNCLVCAHGEREFSLGPRETSSALNDAMPKGIESSESPSRRPFGKSPRRRSVSQHLYFAGQVVSHHGTQCKYLVADQSPSGNDIEAGIVFGKCGVKPTHLTKLA